MAHEKKKAGTVKETHKQTPSGGGPTEVMKQALGVSESEIRHSKLYSFVHEWYGIPYKYGGCQKSGVDCSCFADILYQKVYGVNLSRIAGDIFAKCDMVGVDDLKEGDICFFKINSNTISHVGVYVKNNYFVHASTSKGVMLSNLGETYYKRYFYCGGRVKKS